MQLFLVAPDLSIDEAPIKDVYQSVARLIVAGHDVDLSMIEGLPEKKSLLAKLCVSDAILLYPEWQSNPNSVFLTDVAAKLGLPMFIEKEGKLKPRVEVIGISGYARAGKDTIGDYLITLGYERASFAAPIRNALYTLNPYANNGARIQEIIDEHGWEGSKTVDPEVRLLLQRLGSDVGRVMIDNDIWVDLTLKDIPDGAKIVFTDCRFPNEAAAIKRFGGELWRVTRDGAKPANSHISEIALDDWKFDAYFDNNSTIEDLHIKVSERF